MKVQDNQPSGGRYFRSMKKWMILFCGLLLSELSLSAQPFVRGDSLFTAQGEPLLLRGVNRMFFYQDRDGSRSLPEIAKTGANCVRIFWFTQGSPAELDRILSAVRAHQMVPIVCVWEATGKWERLDECVAYWQRPGIVSVLQAHEEYVLLNIANEAGKYEVSGEEFREAYSRAISQLRKAGIRAPLVIDAAGWGRDERYLLDQGPHLLAQDPQHNVIFSWHPWDTDLPPSRYETAMDQAREKGLCLLIGEFAQHSAPCLCCIDYQAIIRACQEKYVGYLGWSWGPGNGGCEDMNFTEDGTFATLHGYGLEVATTSPYSIAKTSVRSPSLLEEAELALRRTRLQIEPQGRSRWEVTLAEPAKGKAALRLYDTQGQVAWETKTRVKRQKPLKEWVDWSFLPKGEYLFALRLGEQHWLKAVRLE